MAELAQRVQLLAQRQLMLAVAVVDHQTAQQVQVELAVAEQAA
jgi:hypothetical protein